MIKGKTKDWEIIVCTSFLNRFKGNMGKKEIKNVLIFPKCNSVHTFFMRRNIDIVMISKDNIVKFFYQDIPPYRIIFPKKEVFTTIEFPAGENIYQVGDKITYKKED